MAEHKALHYEVMEEGKVRCLLCPHRCRLDSGQAGICRVRSNRNGQLLALNYGEIVSLALDPIEKKPLYHFHPGKNILSTGTIGCNFKCGFCQNYQLAHQSPPTTPLGARELAELTLISTRDNSIGLAFTYNEPGIWFEYIMDVACLLKELGLKVVLVSNGFIEPEPLKQLLPLVDAINIDVKAFSESFYRHHCKGRLEPVKRCVENAMEQVHVEVTTLLIPGENDNPGEMRGLARWLSALKQNTPLHLSRYYPAYKYTRPATDARVLEQCRDAAREFLNFVYLGNLPGEANHTCCLNCGAVLIRRESYQVAIEAWQAGRCQSCGVVIDYLQD